MTTAAAVAQGRGGEDSFSNAWSKTIKAKMNKTKKEASTWQTKRHLAYSHVAHLGVDNVLFALASISACSSPHNSVAPSRADLR